jgi:hypothetical protein
MPLEQALYASYVLTLGSSHSFSVQYRIASQTPVIFTDVALHDNHRRCLGAFTNPYGSALALKFRPVNGIEP